MKRFGHVAVGRVISDNRHPGLPSNEFDDLGIPRIGKSDMQTIHILSEGNDSLAPRDNFGNRPQDRVIDLFLKKTHERNLEMIRDHFPKFLVGEEVEPKNRVTQGHIFQCRSFFRQSELLIVQ